MVFGRCSFGLALWLGPLAAMPAAACDTALLLAIDVSSSIDAGEYRLQVDGLADALADPGIVAALVEGQMALAVMQWSGVGRQAMVQDWQRMTSLAAVAGFARQARATARRYETSDTAIGDAILHGIDSFGPVADCTRAVIDISGDGTANAGVSTTTARNLAEAQGVILNGIAIESLGVAITGFYRQSVITRYGFVMTARGHLDYPRAIREKIRREISKVTG
jgi:Ca-activated chloride channel family protein